MGHHIGAGVPHARYLDHLPAERQAHLHRQRLAGGEEGVAAGQAVGALGVGLGGFQQVAVPFRVGRAQHQHQAFAEHPRVIGRAQGRRATIQIFCGGGTVADATFTSRPLQGNDGGTCTANDFWKVATVVFENQSVCRITHLDEYPTSQEMCSHF